MAFKFEIINNALQVSNTSNGDVLIYLPARDAWFSENDLDNDIVSVYGISGHSTFRDLNLSECVDDEDTPFTDSSFRTWCSINLGNSNGGASSLTTGFIDYNDTTGSINLTADTWTDVPNNGLGAFTNKTYRPELVNEVMNTSTGYLDFSELTLGSQILIRNDFTIVPNTNNCLLEVRYLLGQGAGEYALNFWSERLDNGSGIDYQRVIPFPIYMGDTNTQGGVGKLQVKLSTNGTLNNSGSYINIQLR